MKRFALPVAALSLAACSQQPTAQAPADDSSKERAAPAPTATVTETATATATVTPSPTPSATGAAPAQSIPLAIRGRWGLVPGDCTSTRGDAKGLLTIDATTLRFYESLGTVGAIKQRSDSLIRAAFAFSGEGMTWTRDEVLDAQNGGRTLIRREYGEDAAPGPFKYARCPA
jgi:hypothetical protein